MAMLMSLECLSLRGMSLLWQGEASLALLSDDLPGFSVALSFSDLVVLLPHVHISCGIGCILFATVVEARKVLGKLLGASSDVLFPLIFPLHLIH